MGYQRFVLDSMKLRFPQDRDLHRPAAVTHASERQSDSGQRSSKMTNNQRRRSSIAEFVHNLKPGNRPERGGTIRQLTERGSFIIETPPANGSGDGEVNPDDLTLVIPEPILQSPREMSSETHAQHPSVRLAAKTEMAWDQPHPTQRPVRKGHMATRSPTVSSPLACEYRSRESNQNMGQAVAASSSPHGIKQHISPKLLHANIDNLKAQGFNPETGLFDSLSSTGSITQDVNHHMNFRHRFRDNVIMESISDSPGQHGQSTPINTSTDSSDATTIHKAAPPRMPSYVPGQPDVIVSVRQLGKDHESNKRDTITGIKYHETVPLVAATEVGDTACQSGNVNVTDDQPAQMKREVPEVHQIILNKQLDHVSSRLSQPPSTRHPGSVTSHIEEMKASLVSHRAHSNTSSHNFTTMCKSEMTYQQGHQPTESIVRDLKADDKDSCHRKLNATHTKGTAPQENKPGSDLQTTLTQIEKTPQQSGSHKDSITEDHISAKEYQPPEKVSTGLQEKRQSMKSMQTCTIKSPNVSAPGLSQVACTSTTTTIGNGFDQPHRVPLKAASRQGALGRTLRVPLGPEREQKLPTLLYSRQAAGPKNSLEADSLPSRPMKRPPSLQDHHLAIAAIASTSTSSLTHSTPSTVSKLQCTREKTEALMKHKPPPPRAKTPSTSTSTSPQAFSTPARSEAAKILWGISPAKKLLGHQRLLAAAESSANKAGIADPASKPEKVVQTEDKTQSPSGGKEVDGHCSGTPKIPAQSEPAAECQGFPAQMRLIMAGWSMAGLLFAWVVLKKYWDVAVPAFKEKSAMRERLAKGRPTVGDIVSLVLAANAVFIGILAGV
ncbi:hypothetical protein MCOR25_004626 [Pyricularia grisea]|nr:hypothetical protein MCOR25_004626 [Pyricularia grisea]